jgi:hypothetical protein
VNCLALDMALDLGVRVRCARVLRAARRLRLRLGESAGLAGGYMIMIFFLISLSEPWTVDQYQ